MTQRILAPVRFLDGLTGYPSAVALFGFDDFSHAGIRRPCQYGSRGKSATASNLPPPVRIYAEWATPSNEARTAAGKVRFYLYRYEHRGKMDDRSNANGYRSTLKAFFETLSDFRAAEGSYPKIG